MVAISELLGYKIAAVPRSRQARGGPSRSAPVPQAGPGRREPADCQRSGPQMVTAKNPEPGLVEQFPDGRGQEIVVVWRVVGRRGDAQVAGPAEADRRDLYPPPGQGLVERIYLIS